jgi:catechol 2,3-dioxygenase-like lactoylglutathione lyase family enzyme
VNAPISSLIRAAIFVADLERSTAFYRALGLTETYFEGALNPTSVADVLHVPSDTITRCRILKRPGSANFGMVGLFELSDLPAAAPAPSLSPRRGETALVFYVDDIDACLAAARAHAAMMSAPPVLFSMPHGASRELCLRDPDGVLLNLIGRAPDEQFETDGALRVAARRRPQD